MLPYCLAAFAAVLLTSASAHAQDVDTVLADNQAAALNSGHEAAGSLVLTFDESGQGLSGVAHETTDLGYGRFVESSVNSPVKYRSGFDGLQAWMVDLSGGVSVQRSGETMRLAVNRAYRNANLWWRPDHGGAMVTGAGSDHVDGRICDRLQITPKDGSPFDACFDRVNHLLDRIVERRPFNTTTITYGAYRSVGGVQVAGTRVVDEGSGAGYAETQTLTDARIGKTEAPAAYTPPRSAADTTIEGAAGSTTIPFQLIGDHIYAQVSVNGKGPFTFLFDTGGADILSPSTARVLGIRVQGNAPANGTGEAVEKLGYASGVTFKLGGLVLKDQTVRVLPLGGKEFVGFEIQGVIGYELYHRVVTRIDYGAHTITLTMPARFDPRQAGTPVPFTLYDTVPLVDGSLEGTPARYIIDTGDGGELDVTTPFVAQHDLLKSHPTGLTTGNLGGVGGRTRFYVTRANDLTLGPVRVADLVMRLSMQQSGAFADPGYSGDVGSGLLKRFVVTFDHGHDLIFLRPLSTPVADIASYDQSGLVLENGPGGFVVSSVIPESPAANAGVKPGDVIVAVGDHAAMPKQLSDFQYRLRNAPSGTVIDLRVRSGVELRNLQLVLKKLV